VFALAPQHIVAELAVPTAEEQVLVPDLVYCLRGRDVEIAVAQMRRSKVIEMVVVDAPPEVGFVAGFRQRHASTPEIMVIGGATSSA
jgi:hypothetical protein